MFTHCTTYRINKWRPKYKERKRTACVYDSIVDFQQITLIGLFGNVFNNNCDLNAWFVFIRHFLYPKTLTDRKLKLRLFLTIFFHRLCHLYALNIIRNRKNIFQIIYFINIRFTVTKNNKTIWKNKILRLHFINYIYLNFFGTYLYIDFVRFFLTCFYKI